MKIILEIKFTHRKNKGWIINLPFEIHEWDIPDLINVIDFIDKCFEGIGNPVPVIKRNILRFMFKETWRVYVEAS
jgi:hypothetical protein